MSEALWRLAERQLGLLGHDQVRALGTLGAPTVHRRLASGQWVRESSPGCMPSLAPRTPPIVGLLVGLPGRGWAGRVSHPDRGDPDGPAFRAGPPRPGDLGRSRARPTACAGVTVHRSRDLSLRPPDPGRTDPHHDAGPHAGGSRPGRPLVPSCEICSRCCSPGSRSRSPRPTPHCSSTRVVVGGVAAPCVECSSSAPCSTVPPTASSSRCSPSSAPPTTCHHRSSSSWCGRRQGHRAPPRLRLSRDPPGDRDRRIRDARDRSRIRR